MYTYIALNLLLIHISDIYETQSLMRMATLSRKITFSYLFHPRFLIHPSIYKTIKSVNSQKSTGNLASTLKINFVVRTYRH